MSGKNLVLELNAKMPSANQIGGFLNLNISKTIGSIKLIFWIQVHICYQQIDDLILHEWGQACPKRFWGSIIICLYSGDCNLVCNPRYTSSIQ